MGGFHYFKKRHDTGYHQGLNGFQLHANYLEGNRNPVTTIGDEVPVHPLTTEDVITLVQRGIFELPTEEEIQDRSKSDWLAKTVVIVQTLWFVTQFIIRQIQGLHTTELEILTLAYATVSFGIYIAWWNKPRNVDCPIRVFQMPRRQRHQRMSWNWWAEIGKAIVGTQDIWVDLHQRRKVPKFYSGNPEVSEATFADCLTLAAGVVFGAIHCIAWTFDVSSPTETFLWQISSAAITVLPVFVFLAYLGYSLLGVKLLAFPLFVFMMLSGLLYIVARILTLVLAFVSLTSLPPGTLQAVEWTTWIPHI
jgi:hypothetical protein